MGKSIPSSVRLQELTRIFSSSPDKLHHKPPKQVRPSTSKNRGEAPKNARLGGAIQQKQILSPPAKKKSAMDEGRAGGPAVIPETEGLGRSKLSQVVSDCVRRWFLDTLKEAKAGDSAMQILVGQMYNSGYGVAKDPQKVQQLNLLICWDISWYD